MTDRRVIVFSKRLSGYDVQDYAFGRLAGLDHHKGLAAGQLNLRASGGSADIWLVERRDVERIAAVIRDRMALARQSGGQSAAAVPEHPGTSGRSAADELSKFARLRDEGVISDEEFAAKKAKLLA